MGDSEVAGGQRHFALGRSGDQIRQFLHGTGILQTQQIWSVPLEPWGDVGSAALEIYENSTSAVRVSECRIPSQWPTSRKVLPLWQRIIKSLAINTPPQQAVVIFRDRKNQFHIRVLDATQLHGFAVDRARLIYQSRNDERPLHLYQGKDTFRETALPPDATKRAGKVPQRITRIPVAAASSPNWKQLAVYVRGVQDKPRSKQWRAVEVRVRDSRVHEKALECFEERCQVQNCSCTSGLTSALVPLVLEVHHLKAVAAGGDDSLFNLAVLCANHHRLFERLAGLEALTEPGTDDVLFFTPQEAFLIKRDLTALRRELG